MAEHNQFGHWGEELAAEYVNARGFSILEKNWRCGVHDLDIIALSADKTMIVFVEVKARADSELVEPTNGITKKKIRSLAFAANRYLQLNNIDAEVRFDVLTIVGKSKETAKIDYFEDAFNPLLL